MSWGISGKLVGKLICVRAYVSWVRACVCVRAFACVRACVLVCVCVCVRVLVRVGGILYYRY